MTAWNNFCPVEIRKDLLRLLLAASLLGAALGCGQDKPSYHFTCGVEIPKAELAELAKHSYTSYTATDLNLLGNITKLVHDLHADSAKYEVFFNTKADNLLVLDIYGMGEGAEIDKTACSIFSQEGPGKPARIQLLFHKELKTKGGTEIAVGLQNK